MQSPTISVVMPVYNAEKYLAAAIASILVQSFRDFELIVVNDGSTDGSGAIIQHYADLDARVRPFHQENRGIVQALNTGLAQVRGELIARMDGDDIALPQRFARQVAYLRQHPTVGVVGCAFQAIDATGAAMPNDVGFMEHGTFVLKWQSFFAPPVAHPTVMMHAAVMERQLYPQQMAEDYALWLALIPTVLFDNVPEVLLLYRRHPQSLTQSQTLANDEAAAHSRQAYWQAVMGIELTLEDALALHTLVASSPAQCQRLMTTIQAAQRKFFALHPNVPPAERAAIEKLAFQRRFRLWKRHKGHLPMLRSFSCQDIVPIWQLAQPRIAKVLAGGKA